MFGHSLNQVEGPGLADLHHYGGYLSIIDRIFKRVVPGGLAGVCGKLHIDREPLLHRSLFGCDADWQATQSMREIRILSIREL